ncbi:MAG TPA: hypothetical protein DCW44_02240 [Eubacterium sp.]|nr:hypothetical protein [Eubacterium sp.]
MDLIQLNKKIFQGRVHSKQRKVLFLFIILALAILSVFILLQLKESKELKKDEQIKKKLIEEKSKDDEENKSQDQKKNKQLIRLKKKYPDMVGWVEIKGTDFSYPVMQSGKKNHHEDDSEFYLNRNVYGEVSATGTPFLDSRCDIDSDELIIYGHNMTGKTHFGFLQNYRDEEFYKKHKMICFTKVGGMEEKYDILSVLVTDIYSDCFKNTDAYNDEEYKSFIEEIINRSLYQCDIADEVKTNMKKDSVEEFFHKYQLITLATCRTGEGRDARLLVIGCRERTIGPSAQK